MALRVPCKTVMLRNLTWYIYSRRGVEGQLFQTYFECPETIVVENWGRLLLPSSLYSCGSFSVAHACSLRLLCPHAELWVSLSDSLSCNECCASVLRSMHGTLAQDTKEAASITSEQGYDKAGCTSSHLLLPSDFRLWCPAVASIWHPACNWPALCTCLHRCHTLRELENLLTEQRNGTSTSNTSQHPARVPVRK
jgi:hypothetical protein